MILNWLSKRFYALAAKFDRWYTKYWNWRWEDAVRDGKFIIGGHLFLEDIKVQEWEYRLRRYGGGDWSFWLTAWVSEEDFDWETYKRVEDIINKEWFFNAPDEFLDHFMYDIRPR